MSSSIVREQPPDPGNRCVVVEQLDRIELMVFAERTRDLIWTARVVVDESLRIA